MGYHLIILLLTLLATSGCRPARVHQSPLPKHMLTDWHAPFREGQRWRLTNAGVEIEGSGIERTPGRPLTVTWIWEAYGKSIDRWSVHYGAPAELIIAVIATEAGTISGASRFSRDPKSLRKEKGFLSLRKTPHLISVGLMQTTVATARAALKLEGVESAGIGIRFLSDADRSIRAGASVLAWQARGQLCNVATLFDPPVAFAAYNSGGLYLSRSRANRWRMRQYPLGTSRHVDKAIRYFNDAVAALKTHRNKPSFGFSQYLRHLPDERDFVSSVRMPSSLRRCLGGCCG